MENSVDGSERALGRAWIYHGYDSPDPEESCIRVPEGPLGLFDPRVLLELERRRDGSHWLADDPRLGCQELEDVAEALDGFFGGRLSQYYPIIGWDETAESPFYSTTVVPMQTMMLWPRDHEHFFWTLEHMIDMLVETIKARLPPEQYPILGYRTPLGISLVTVGMVLPLCLILVAFLWARIEGYFSWAIALHGCWVTPLSLAFVVAGIMCHMAGWD